MTRWQEILLIVVPVGGVAAVLVLPGQILTACVCAGVLFVWLYVLLREGRGIPYTCCQRCGYNLRGNASGRCPECGARID